MRGRARTVAAVMTTTCRSEQTMTTPNPIRDQLGRILIVQDTREQRPYATKGGADGMAAQDMTILQRALLAGDYALLADCTEMPKRKRLVPGYAVERKSVSDFVTSWLIDRNRRREVAKLRRLRKVGGSLCYVLDGNEDAIRRYEYDRFHGRRSSAGVFAWIDWLRARRVAVVLSKSKTWAARHCFGLLAARADALAERMAKNT